MSSFACWDGLWRLCYVLWTDMDYAFFPFSVHNWCCGFHFTFSAIARGVFYLCILYMIYFLYFQLSDNHLSIYVTYVRKLNLSVKKKKPQSASPCNAKLQPYPCFMIPILLCKLTKTIPRPTIPPRKPAKKTPSTSMTSSRSTEILLVNQHTRICKGIAATTPAL